MSAEKPIVVLNSALGLVSEEGCPLVVEVQISASSSRLCPSLWTYYEMHPETWRRWAEDKRDAFDRREERDRISA